jgi:hypothetical protein
VGAKVLRGRSREGCEVPWVAATRRGGDYGIVGDLFEVALFPEKEYQVLLSEQGQQRA